MIVKKLKVIDGRNYLNGQLLSHIVWDHFHPNDKWKKGYVIHHKDKDTLNDWHENLDKLINGGHTYLHSKGNTHWLGKKHTEETKKKLSATKIGNKNPMYGTKHSLEWKEKMSLGKKGIPRSEEVKKKISIGNMGNKNRLGQKSTGEHKRKISESIKEWHKNRKTVIV